MKKHNKINVAVIGASDKKHRYSYQAVLLLKEKGFNVFPVHKRVNFIDGIKVNKSILDIYDNIDVITLYVNKNISNAIAENILARKPKTIIFNPGTENPDLEKKALLKNIKTVNACSLVMIKTGMFNEIIK
jgi:hypothetical protein